MKMFGSFRLARLLVLAVFAGCFLLSGCGDSNEWWYVNTNNGPVADAGPDQTVLTGDTVTLDGTGSTDKDGNQLTYSWSIAQKPVGSAAVLTGSSSATPTFVADMEGQYLIELVVSDGKLSSVADTVTVTASNTLGYDYAPGEAFAWLAIGQSPELSGLAGFVKVNLSSGAITPVGALQQADGTFMAGADFVKGRYLCVQYPTNKLFYINGDGSYQEITTLAGVNAITGLSYDAAADKIYVADYTGSGTVLRAISTTDFSISLVGTITSEIIIGLASDASGTLYGISLDADNLYRIDTTTGAGTIVGSLGININYAQGIAYDRTNNILYGTLYEMVAGGGVYTINTSTGAATPVAPLGGELDGFAIPPQPLNPPT